MLKVLDLRTSRGSEFIRGAYRTRVQDLQFHALPPPITKILILEDEGTREEIRRISDDAASDAKEFLKLRGWEQVELFAQCRDLVDSCDSALQTVTVPGPQGILWEANPLLSCFLEGRSDTLRGSIVLDAGSGVGRDAILLAKGGAIVIAVEARRVLSDACERLCKIADVAYTRCEGPLCPRINRSHISGHGGRLFICNGKIDATFLSSLGTVDIVHVCRFFQRDLLESMMCRANSYFLCHHFLAGSCRPCGADQVLRDAEELGDLASVLDLEVVLDEVLEIVDHVGLRKLSMFICQKPISR